MQVNKKYLNKCLKDIILKPLYNESESQKRKKLIKLLKIVLQYQYDNCQEYKNICKYFRFHPKKLSNFSQIPYLTSSVFKENLISSIPKSKIFRQINSSATTSDNYSKIVLDKENNNRWSLSLQKMFLDRVGNERYKILFLDTKENMKKTSILSARSSMLKSFLFVSNSYSTCLKLSKGKLMLDKRALNSFFRSIKKNEKIMIFGFTYVIYKHFLMEIIRDNKNYDLSNSILVHAGGWKKLEKEKVSRKKLNYLIQKFLKIKIDNIIDIYGFSEQGGLLYPTCEKGFRHCTNYSTLIIRSFKNFEIIRKIKKIGFLQFITPIQLSYPGNSFLTEDVGRIEGIDDCRCGRNGIYFKVIGRYKHETEIRGCGDIMSSQFYEN